MQLHYGCTGASAPQRKLGVNEMRLKLDDDAGGGTIVINPDAIAYVTEGRAEPHEPDHPDTPRDDRPPTTNVFLTGRTEPFIVEGTIDDLGLHWANETRPSNSEARQHRAQNAAVKEREFASSKPGDTKLDMSKAKLEPGNVAAASNTGAPSPASSAKHGMRSTADNK